MDVEVTEEIVIAKPVACRLNFSSFRSFSKSLSSSNDASPPPPDIPQAPGAVVIKPITMRFRPNCNRDVPKAGIFNSADCHLSKIVHESSPKDNVLYKPIVKLASRAAAISSLANLGDQCHGIIPTHEIGEIASGTLKSNQVYSSTSKILETQKQPMTNFAAVPDDGDRPSSDQDHHSWRKYGQKSVKESEYPRSYYKCTYPNCPVKKKVDKMSDDHIEEEMVYVYDGEHNHTICQIPCHPMPDKKTRNITTQSETKIQSDSASSSESTAQPTGDPVIKTGTATSGVVGECEEVSEYVDAEGDDFQSKRRGKNRLSEARISGVSSAEPQKNLVPDNNDEFRWRKYGQKVVKGNLYARSYYKCTNPKCSARKYVERTPKDPGTFITTYEGRHDHGILISGTNLDKRKTNTRKKS